MKIDKNSIILTCLICLAFFCLMFILFFCEIQKKRILVERFKIQHKMLLRRDQNEAN